MVRLILVRHGETYWNEEGRFQGRIDVELNKNGKDQAARLAKALKDVKIDAIYSSPLKRSFFTAEAVAEEHGLPVQKVSEFNEIDHGLWEGSTIDQVLEEDKEAYQTWLDNPEKVSMPSGEDLEDLRSRAVSKLHQVLERHKDGETILIVGHDATNKIIICHALGLDNSHFWKIKQGNASIDVLEYKNGRFRITLLNDTCHLGGIVDTTTPGAL